jgi:hypothetical protein
MSSCESPALTSASPSLKAPESLRIKQLEQQTSRFAIQ